MYLFSGGFWMDGMVRGGGQVVEMGRALSEGGYNAVSHSGETPRLTGSRFLVSCSVRSVRRTVRVRYPACSVLYYILWRITFTCIADKHAKIDE